MPKQIVASTDKFNFLKGRNQRYLKVHEGFHGMDYDDVYMLMTEEEQLFAQEYMRSDCNASQAAFIGCFGGDHGKFKSEKHRQQMCSPKGMKMLVIPTVSSYLYLRRRKMLEIQKKREQRTFDKYVDKLEEIRDSALACEDHGAAVRAHKDLGVICGHLESEDNNNASKTSDADLIKQIAKGNAQMSAMLAKQMGIKLDDGVIEGELV